MDEMIRNGLRYLANETDDEKYAKGFWDLAGIVAEELVGEGITDDAAGLVDEAQESLYNIFRAIGEAAIR